MFYFISFIFFFAILCDKVCQWFATDRWFSPVSYTNKTDRHDIAEILLKVVVKHDKPNHVFSLLGPVPPKYESAIYYECVISWLYNLKTLSVSDEGYSRNALNWISTFLLFMDNPPLWWDGNACLLYGEYQTHIRRKRQLVAAIDEHSARFRWREAPPKTRWRWMIALFFFVSCILCCQFLWIVHLWLPFWYSLMLISQFE